MPSSCAEKLSFPEALPKINRTLGIVAEMPVVMKNGQIWGHLSFGKIIDILAERYEHVLLCAPTLPADSASHRDYALQTDNVTLIPQPMYSSSIAALKQPAGILKAYKETLKQADDIFIRGMLPFTAGFYSIAAAFKRKPVHWVVGNPIALLKSHHRSGKLKDALGLLYAYQDRFFTKLGRKLTGGAFVCNGNELACIYCSARTRSVVSSTITEDEFFVREDTCCNDEIKILFVGFVRPEKGIEYLIEAISKLKTNRPCSLTVIGPWQQFQEYKTKLDTLINNLDLTEKIKWKGHISGPEMWSYLREHDIFVLPTLSEGTPRVLVEARANGIPVIATNVGGIPTSVTDGIDGLLIAPKDPDALAGAIDTVIEDGDLRRRLIKSGLLSVRRMTVNRFVDSVMDELINE